MKPSIPQKLKPLVRSFRLDNAAPSAVDTAARTMRLSFSSEQPVDMGWCTEILSHKSGAIKLAGRQKSMPLLFNHNMDDLLGIVESIDIGADNRGYANIRFGKDTRGDWAMNQAADGVLINASFMYRVYRYEEDIDTETITATLWEPFEVSLVTVPADASVGVGRAATDSENEVEIVQRSLPAHTDPPDKPIEPIPIENATSKPAQAGFLTTDESRNTFDSNRNPSAAAETLEETTMKQRHILQDQANDGTSGAAGGTVLSSEERAKIQLEARTSAIADERSRATEIEAMCRSHKLDDNFRNQMINDNVSISEARQKVLLAISARGEQKPVGGLADEFKEKGQTFSIVRAANAVLNKSWKEAGYERAISDELAKRNGREASGESFFMPNDLPFAPTRAHMEALRAGSAKYRNQRAIYQVGTAVQGGNLVETDLLAENFIEVLRNQTVVSQLGATYLTGLVGNVDIPRQNAQSTAYWVGESAPLTESEATFDKVSLRPKTLGVFSKASRLALMQTTPAIEMLLRADLVAVGALGIDLNALSGAGTGGAPLGIVNQAGVGSVVGGVNGASLTLDNLTQLKYATRFANAPQDSVGFAMNSKAVGYLQTVKSSTGAPLWDPAMGYVAGAPNMVKGVPYVESQQLRSTLTKGTSTGICSEIIYGNWQELIIGMWGVTEIAVNPYDSTGFANGDVQFRLFQTLDIAVRHAASFAVMTDALTPGF